MPASELLAPLLEATLAVAAATVLVLALRRSLRSAFGAGVAYAAWALVPAALLAVLLPAATAQAPPAIATATMALSATPPPVAAAVAPAAWPEWLLAAWLAGTLAMLAVAWLRQRAFLRGLGQLRRYARDCWLAESVAGLPALVGLWRPRIVLPGDFERRFHPRERALVLRHERMHLARGDAAANALAMLLRCLFWFNPLLPPALRAFRQDQELACDARVLARRPALRRAYGEAMFKAQLAAQPLPLACHWGFGHPLKERIAMLKAPMVSPRRQRAGLAAVAVLALATGFAAWAAQPKRVAPLVVPDGHLHARQQMRVDPYQLRDGETVVEPVLVQGRDRPAANGFHGRQLASAPPPPAPPPPPAVANPPAVPAPPAPPAMPPGARSVPAPPAPPTPPAPRDVSAAPPAPPAPPAAPAAPAAPALPTPPAAPAPPSVPHLPAPRYPGQALEQKLSGRVVLLVDIDTDGRPTAIKVESADPPGVFEQEATRAAWQWRFQPAIEGGRAVRSQVRVPVDFRMDGPPPAPAPEA